MLIAEVIIVKGYLCWTFYATSFYDFFTIFCVCTSLCTFTSKCEIFFSEYYMERQSFNCRFVVSVQNKNENERAIEKQIIFFVCFMPILLFKSLYTHYPSGLLYFIVLFSSCHLF